MMKWFGKSWGAPFCRDGEHVPTPVGEVCSWCEEAIEEGDQGVRYSNGPVSHLNCFLRQTIGSVAHVLGMCSCVIPGATETDPPELTTRQAADLAVELHQKKTTGNIGGDAA